MWRSLDAQDKSDLQSWAAAEMELRGIEVESKKVD